MIKTIKRLALATINTVNIMVSSLAKGCEAKKEEHKTSIGGQALIEGVMLQGPTNTAMAVRLPNKEIETIEFPEQSKNLKSWYRKVPFIRGTFNMIHSMIFGFKCLSISAEKSTAEEDEQLSPFEQKLEKLFGEKLFTVIMSIGVVLGVGLSMLLFMYLPALASSLIFGELDTVASAGGVGVLKALVEGVLKIAIFILYIFVISRLKDVKRLFQYHGAEHKTIACYESGDEVTPENAKKHLRFHPRCGTSFLFIVLIVSILIFSLPIVPWNNMLLRVGIKILLLPVVVGISYEIIKIAGRHENWFTKIISYPGISMQHLTTNEPDRSQLEVAIAAFKPVCPEDKEADRW